MDGLLGLSWTLRPRVSFLLFGDSTQTSSSVPRPSVSRDTRFFPHTYNWILTASRRPPELRLRTVLEGCQTFLVSDDTPLTYPNLRSHLRNLPRRVTGPSSTVTKLGPGLPTPPYRRRGRIDTSKTRGRYITGRVVTKDPLFDRKKMFSKYHLTMK